MPDVAVDSPSPARLWPVGAVVVLAVAAAVFLVRLGDRAVTSEEMRWAEVVREMRASGDYLHPTINGHTYYDKPVGSYWLIVAASHLTGGVNETAARLPAALAGWLGVLFVMLLGRRLYDERTAVLAGAILATSFGRARSPDPGRSRPPAADDSRRWCERTVGPFSPECRGLSSPGPPC